LIPFAHFSIAFAIACLIALLYGILFSIWFATMKPTTFALISGFFISLTSRITFFPNFLERRFSRVVLFSPVFPKTKADLAVYTTAIISSLPVDIRISPKGIPVNSLFSNCLTVKSKPSESLYVFLSAYQDDFQVLI
jgi:hypothetical protein